MRIHVELIQTQLEMVGKGVDHMHTYDQATSFLIKCNAWRVVCITHIVLQYNTWDCQAQRSGEVESLEVKVKIVFDLSCPQTAWKESESGGEKGRVLSPYGRSPQSLNSEGLELLIIVDWISYIYIMYYW
jgi:hypothetical protein